MSRQSRKLNILLVEDNPGDILLAREALMDDAQVNPLYVAGNGEEAEAFLRRQQAFASAPRPDLILLDLNLPRKSGLELLAEIKGDPELRAIPTVVLTVSSSREDVERAYFHHANCFVTKPVKLAEFLELIRSLKSFWFEIATLPAS